MRYEKAFAELIVIDRGDVITTSCFGSSDECDDKDNDNEYFKMFPGRDPNR